MSSTLPVPLSVEFFPPRNEQAQLQLLTAANALKQMEPEFCSVTFGAGGSTKEKTLETVLVIQSQTQLTAVPHISCISSSKEEIKQLLSIYQSHNISQLVVLRGDLPSGSGAPSGDFRYANELVSFIRAETKDYFTIYIAAYPEFHPETKQADMEIINFKRKADAGADHAITQYFYNSDAYFYFSDQCIKQGIHTPITPGIMPITNFDSLIRFSNFCGAEIPKWILNRLYQYKDDNESLRNFGLDVVSQLCQDLLANGAPGLHFYTLNKAEPTLAIYNNLSL